MAFAQLGPGILGAVPTLPRPPKSAGSSCLQNSGFQSHGEYPQSIFIHFRLGCYTKCKPSSELLGIPRKPWKPNFLIQWDVREYGVNEEIAGDPDSYKQISYRLCVFPPDFPLRFWETTKQDWNVCSTPDHGEGGPKGNGFNAGHMYCI